MPVNAVEGDHLRTRSQGCDETTLGWGLAYAKGGRPHAARAAANLSFGNIEGRGVGAKPCQSPTGTSIASTFRTRTKGAVLVTGVGSDARAASPRSSPGCIRICTDHKPHRTAGGPQGPSNAGVETRHAAVRHYFVEQALPALTWLRTSNTNVAGLV
jgi:hypothetical protein